MKKYISLFLCILLLASCSNSGEKRSRVLKVYNWADYIDEEVLTEFPAWYRQAKTFVLFTKYSISTKSCSLKLSADRKISTLYAHRNTSSNEC